MLAQKTDNPSHFDTHALQTTQPFQPEHRQAFYSNIGKRCFIALFAPDNDYDASSTRQNEAAGRESGETNRRAKADCPQLTERSLTNLSLKNNANVTLNAHKLRSLCFLKQACALASG